MAIASCFCSVSVSASAKGCSVGEVGVSAHTSAWKRPLQQHERWQEWVLGLGTLCLPLQQKCCSPWNWDQTLCVYNKVVLEKSASSLQLSVCAAGSVSLVDNDRVGTHRCQHWVPAWWTGGAFMAGAGAWGPGALPSLAMWFGAAGVSCVRGEVRGLKWLMLWLSKVLSSGGTSESNNKYTFKASFFEKVGLCWFLLDVDCTSCCVWLVVGHCYCIHKIKAY